MILLKKRLSSEKLFELMKGKYILISKNIDTQLSRRGQIDPQQGREAPDNFPRPV